MPAYSLYLFCFTNQGQIGLNTLCPQHEEMLCNAPTHQTMKPTSLPSATPMVTQSLRITYAPNAITHALLRHALSSYATCKKPLTPTNAYYVTHAVRCLPSGNPRSNKAEYCLSTRAPQPTSATLRCSSN